MDPAYKRINFGVPLRIQKIAPGDMAGRQGTTRSRERPDRQELKPDVF
jgi:hypothetical protein